MNNPYNRLPSIFQYRNTGCYSKRFLLTGILFNEEFSSLNESMIVAIMNHIIETSCHAGISKQPGKRDEIRNNAPGTVSAPSVGVVCLALTPMALQLSPET